jgi:hypothetical protein
VCNRFGEDYLSAYQTFVQVSEPEEDFDGRVDLYKLFVARRYSALIIIEVRFASEIKTDYRPDASTRTSQLSFTTTWPFANSKLTAHV